MTIRKLARLLVLAPCAALIAAAAPRMLAFAQDTSTPARDSASSERATAPAQDVGSATPNASAPAAAKAKATRKPGASAAARADTRDPLREWTGPCAIRHAELLVHAPSDFAWTAREAEHLLNRAGFGARPHEIDAAVKLGVDAFVLALLRGPEVTPEPFWAEPRSDRDGLKQVDEAGADPELRKQRDARLRALDRQQLAAYTHAWLDRMLAGVDPLRERMTLFWHGHFTSSMQDVKSSWQMIRQNEFLRANALGRFADLVHGIARDPAMLEYLDNNSNKRGAPNENFARELLELFTLGVGHYDERDVQETARAFTGWSGKGAEFRVNAKQHDAGAKTVLGVSGELSGDDVIEIVVRAPACAEHVARRLLAWFEGAEPRAERVAEYAAFLREHDGEIWAFLNKLFVDPRFYRDEIVGARISSPIDYLVGSARRLGAQPPAALLAVGARALGQQLFEPPNVKGWEGGESWITTSTFMQRGNLAGMLLGVVDAADILEPEPAEPASSASRETMTGAMEAAPSSAAASEAAAAANAQPPERAADAAAPDMRADSMQDASSATARDASSMAPHDVSSAASHDVAPATPEASTNAPQPPSKPTSPKKSAAKRSELLTQLERFDQQGWRPSIHLGARLARRGAVSDEQRIDALADELLARPLPPETRAHMLDVFAAERRDDAGMRGWSGGPRDDSMRDEALLRRVAHVLLSLPEAQLD